MMNALVELCPKEVVDELTWGLILVARRLVLEYEIWRGGPRERMFKFRYQSCSRLGLAMAMTHRRPSAASRQRCQAPWC
jgi:hypothetical protein